MKKKFKPKQIDVIAQWCLNARKLGYTKKEVKQHTKSLPRDVKKQIMKTFKDLEYIEKESSWLNKLKGGYPYMAFKKKKDFDEEEEDDGFVEEEDEEYEDLDSEEDDVKGTPGRKKKSNRPPAVYQQPMNTIKQKGWQIKSVPQKFQCIDPVNGELICEGGSYEELMLNLQVMATQYAVESAKNTR